MTYNFDPERWREMHEIALTARRDRGELTDEEFGRMLEELERRYEEMTSRLDGTYRLPG